MKEIHQDPLRKRSKVKDEVSLKEGNPTLNLISKLEELIKIIVNNKSIDQKILISDYKKWTQEFIMVNTH